MSKQMREMKDSGIEWIGEIPKEWDLIKCKYVTEVYTGNSIKDEEKGLYEDPVDSIPYISTKDIDATFNSVAYDNGLFIKKIDTSFVRANKGDTLMCIEGGSAGRKKAILDRTVCFVNKLCCFHPTRINPVYLFYILNSPHYEEEFSVNMSGLIGGVSKGKLMNFILPYPCYDTQHRIADYLDDKCGKIDRYIEQQKQVIEKLKAYKQSVITESVTKGLDPTVPMKDSGVEWIGEIPEGWEVSKFKFLGKFINGYAFPSSAFKTTGIRVMKIANIQPMHIVWEDESFVDHKYLNLTDYLVEKDNLVFALTRPIINGGIKVAIADNVEKVLLNQRNAMFKGHKEVTAKWQYYLMQNNMFVQEFALYIDGTGQQPNISTNEIANIPIPIPSISDQKKITEYLDNNCSEIDSTIEKKQALIDKLTEYKKSLIYEVVTGKKEV